MADNVEGWAGVIKILFEAKPRYSFVFWAPCAFVIFSPIWLLEKFGIATFVEQFRGWIGAIGIVFFVLWLVHLYSTITEARKNKSELQQKEQEDEEYKESVIKYLRNNSLSQGEHRLICYALYKRQQVFHIDFINEHAQALVRKGLVTVSGQGAADNFPFMIPDFVWKYLENNKRRFLPEKGEDLKNFEEWVYAYEHARKWQRGNYL